jgi:hypothetical protein
MFSYQTSTEFLPCWVDHDKFTILHTNLNINAGRIFEQPLHTLNAVVSRQWRLGALPVIGSPQTSHIASSILSIF